MRRKLKKKNIVGPDHTWNSAKVAKLVNYVMQEGKKATATNIVNQAFAIIKEKGKVENPVEVFETAMRNVGPVVEVRSRRVGGANYQVPREVRPERRQALALRWIVGAARAKKGVAMHKKLAAEILAASNNEGEAMKKKEGVHKMAESNKAFAHFSW